MKKRVMSLLLAVLTMLSLVTPAFAEEDNWETLTDEEMQELIDAGEAFQFEGTPSNGAVSIADEASGTGNSSSDEETTGDRETASDTDETGDETVVPDVTEPVLKVNGANKDALVSGKSPITGDETDLLVDGGKLTGGEGYLILKGGYEISAIDGGTKEPQDPVTSEELRALYEGKDLPELDADTYTIYHITAADGAATVTVTISASEQADETTDGTDETPKTEGGDPTDSEGSDTDATLATPEITSVSNTTSGVKITWGAVTGAAKYRVFYKNGNGWTKIADTTGTSYTWTGAKNNTSYTFTVRCVTADGKSYASAYDKTGKTITYYSCATPKLTAITNTAEGVKITWGKVAGAAKYRVFYKTSSGWQKIADTAATSYTWTKAKSGTTYTFTVRCLSSNALVYTSAYDSTGMTGTYVAAPKLTAASNTADGVNITWGKVAGAAKYRVFYKTGSGSWTEIEDTTATSYTWTGAKNNTKYTFTVRCVTEDGAAYTSGFDGKGIANTYLTAPQISALTNTAEGIKITWGKVAGAAKYRVFYKTGSGWTKIADTAATSYTWTGPKSGTTYTFTVRCLSSNGKSYTSGYNGTGASVTFIAAPKVSTISNAAEGVNITWGAVKGAVKYRVFYKTASVGWTEIVDTAATSYTWKEAKSNINYTFTVRCVTEDGTAYTSGYDGRGKSLKHIAAPVISSLTNSAEGVTVKWDAVAGAGKYRVFYKTASGWTKIVDTTATSYTWTGAKNGTNYTFTVRCLSGDGKSYISGYYGTGWTVTYVEELLPAPVLTGAENTTTGVKITWNAVAGASKYRVFYKTGSGGWTRIADTKDTSCTWTGAKSGTTYTFTVRCLSWDSVKYTSPYDSVGKTITYIAAPTITAVTNATNGGVKITWGKVAGAAKYRVFYRNAGGSWTQIADTTSTSYTWKGAEAGTTYTFTVRCISSDGNSYTSAYRAGKTFTPPKIETKNGVTYVNGYLIVNKTYSIPASYGSGLTKETQNAFDSMAAAARKDGISLYITSGFRSYSTQSSLYARYVSRDGRAKADTYSARPGHSEHQTGLAVDLNVVSDAFNSTREARWLANNCYKYGFILRYPSGKTNETGYKYESWHYRYVGKELAKILYNGGNWITMEAYFGLTSQY